jgi:hypothetical protein
MRGFRFLLVVFAGLSVLAGGCGNDGGLGLPTVDTVPPVPPVNLQIGCDSDMVTITWAANAEPDLAGYRLYRSAYEDGPFGLVSMGLLYCPWYHDKGSPMAMTYYKVSAVDQSGNESAYSQTVGLYYNTDRRSGPVIPVQ